MNLGLVKMNSEINDNEMSNPVKIDIDNIVYFKFENTSNITRFCMLYLRPIDHIQLPKNAQI